MEDIRDRSLIRQRYLINLNNFEFIKKIKVGGFGKVCLIKDKNTNKELAAKILPLEDENEQRKKMINREIGIMMILQHPTIIQFHGYSLYDFEGKNNVTIIMDLAKKGSLATLLQNSKQGLADMEYNNTIRQKILIGIARGMMYLHQNRIIHRDLKPGNILLDENYNPHITDFGLSKVIEYGRSNDQTHGYGTSIYMAPEVIKGSPYNGKADVYSFAILMYEVVTDLLPYPSFQTDKMSLFDFNNEVVNKNFRPEFSIPIKDSLKKLIIQCWSADPKERPTFEEIFNKLAFNLEESVYDVFTDDYKYYLENVDVDEVLSYAYEITENDRKSESDQIRIEMQKQQEMINSLSQENQQLKAENIEMKQKIAELFELVANLPQKKIEPQIMSFAYSKDHEFEGIFNFLTTKNKGKNIHDSQIVVITSNSMKKDSEPRYLVQDDGYYLSSEVDNVYVCFEFKEFSIQLSSYVIQTGNGGKGGSHLRNWEIQCSNDKKNWKTVDIRIDEPSLNDCHKVAAFDVQNQSDEFYHFIKLITTGDSWRGIGYKKRICVRRIELFGNIKEN